MNTNNSNNTQTNKKLGFLPPLYKGFGNLDNQTSINGLQDKNKRIIESLQEVLIDKNGGGHNTLYVADLGITTTPENIEHNKQSLNQLYNGIIKELNSDFDIQLLSLTDLKQVIAPFYGTELHGSSNEELRLYIARMGLHSIEQFHQYLDRLYKKSNLYAPINMKSFFKGHDKNKIQFLGNK